MLRVVEAVQRTDVGRQREANEDSYFVRAPVFVVADGMGGAQAERSPRGSQSTPSSPTATRGSPPRST